ncbi:hypothetical protein M427DRAFT_158311 [Gonapodya prolifera JEL478]|uniref:Uncharacterized protein n=1 Tax=Gonapodya prolifera (strain JEL478) TaxID=1344416 RepID=A0A139A464_GONPJ|nr:hypothetical protein M427DRAFT_158311 [Gonapodya prolifera JEL478]|eukprot:KXS11265.1 hypothetical protein M427DRAFT_158311 [Gonapodya prolifera JEL478]
MASSGYAPLSSGDGSYNPPPPQIPWTTIILSLGILIAISFFIPSAFFLSRAFSAAQVVVAVLSVAALLLSSGGLYIWLRGPEHQRELVAVYNSHIFNGILGAIILVNAFVAWGSILAVLQVILGAAMLALGILGTYVAYRSRGGSPLNWGVPSFPSSGHPRTQEPKAYRLDGGAV